jgi:ribosomal protein L1
MAGQVQFKADRFGMLHATVGKVRHSPYSVHPDFI